MARADALQGLLRLPGATYACVVERDGGRVLAETGRGEGGAGDGEGVVPYSVAGWGTAVAAMFDTTSGDELDDVMITGRRSYHLVRPLGPGAAVLVYLRLDRARSNLAAARRELAAVRWGAVDAGAATGGAPPVAAPRRAGAPGPGTDAGARVPRARGEPRGRPASSPPGPAPRIPLPRRAPAPYPDDARRRAAHRAPGDLAAVPEGFTLPAVLGQSWAHDPVTLRRLVAGLRRLS